MRLRRVQATGSAPGGTPRPDPKRMPSRRTSCTNSRRAAGDGVVRFRSRRGEACTGRLRGSVSAHQVSMSVQLQTGPISRVMRGLGKLRWCRRQRLNDFRGRPSRPAISGALTRSAASTNLAAARAAGAGSTAAQRPVATAHASMSAHDHTWPMANLATGRGKAGYSRSQVWAMLRRRPSLSAISAVPTRSATSTVLPTAAERYAQDCCRRHRPGSRRLNVTRGRGRGWPPRPTDRARQTPSSRGPGGSVVERRSNLAAGGP